MILFFRIISLYILNYTYNYEVLDCEKPRMNRSSFYRDDLVREFIREALNAERVLLREALIIEDFENTVDMMISEGFLDLVRSAYKKSMGAAGSLSRPVVDALQKVNNVFIGLVQRAISAARSSAQSGIKFYRTIVNKVSAFKEAHPLLFKIVMVVLSVVLVYAALSLFDTSTAHASLSAGGKQVDEKTYLEVRGMLLQHMDRVDSSNIDKKLELGKIITELDTAFKSKDTFQIEKFSGAAGKFITKAYQIVGDLIKETQSSDSKVSATATEILKQWYQVAKSTTLSAL